MNFLGGRKRVSCKGEKRFTRFERTGVGIIFKDHGLSAVGMRYSRGTQGNGLFMGTFDQFLCATGYSRNSI